MIMIDPPSLSSRPVARAFARRMLGWAVACLALALASTAPWAATQAPTPTRGPDAVAITPADGPSWLHRLGLQVEETCMGSAGPWVSSPVASPPPEWDEAAAASIEEGSVTLTGADLYRFGCQPCHKADGSGVPPEIPTIIGPVRSTSPVAFQAQMKSRGYEMDEDAIREMTTQAEQTLRERIARGGVKMPSFAHLGAGEVRALLAHLRLLAGVPGAESRSIRLVVPALRVGEYVVKGTCKVCHDATGQGRDDPLELSMMRGLIPSLASIPEQRTKAEVIRKVHVGLAEPLPYMTHGRMPVLDYLTDAEVSAVYEYLHRYRPE